MIYSKVLLLLLFGLLPLYRLESHSYKFSQTSEEMKDKVWIYIQPEQITIQYESEYLGQIAPHIRIMIDSNTDSILTTEELNKFFSNYKKLINTTLQSFPLSVGTKPSIVKLVDIQTPTIQTDSLLAPFKIRMIFTINDLKMDQGKHELVIDPKLFFLNGNQFINMAKRRVNFTDKQEQAIGRFLQIKIFASESILFTSTFPGYIRKDKRSIFIYGVFYDETILRIKNSLYPKLRVKFISI